MLKTFVRSLALFLLAVPVVSLSQQVGQLPQGVTVLQLPTEDQARLVAIQKDAEILALKSQLISSRVETAQAQAQEIKNEQATYVDRLKSEVAAIRSKNKYGDDVTFDYQRGAFLQVARPAGATATAKTAAASASTATPEVSDQVKRAQEEAKAYKAVPATPAVTAKPATK